MRHLDFVQDVARTLLFHPLRSRHEEGFLEMAVESNYGHIDQRSQLLQVLRLTVVRQDQVFKLHLVAQDRIEKASQLFPSVIRLQQEKQFLTLGLVVAKAIQAVVQAIDHKEKGNR